MHTSPPRLVFADLNFDRCARQALIGLRDAGMLARYATTWAYLPGSGQGRALRAALRAARLPEGRLAGRRVDEVPAELVRLYPWFELARLAAGRLRLGRRAGDLLWDQGMRAFDAHVAGSLPRDIAGVIATDYAALAIFRAARERGLAAILNLHSVHHGTMQPILEGEYAAFPAAVSGYDRHVRPLAERRNGRRAAEEALADGAIVLSSFARGALVAAGVPAERVRVVPLGAPPVAPPRPRPAPGPAVFLCAGNLALHKGTQYLLEAWRRLRPGAAAELWLVGELHLPEPMLRDLPAGISIRPRVPYEELQAIYRRASALVFPSLCDGFGAVINEAMAQGLPVITTPHTGGPDVIAHGEDGLIVPVRDADALAATMAWCLDHPDELEALGRRGRERAAQWQWPDYRRAFAAAAADLVAAGRREPGPGPVPGPAGAVPTIRS